MDIWLADFTWAWSKNNGDDTHTCIAAALEPNLFTSLLCPSASIFTTVFTPVLPAYTVGLRSERARTHGGTTPPPRHLARPRHGVAPRMMLQFLHPTGMALSGRDGRRRIDQCKGEGYGDDDGNGDCFRS